MGFSWIYFKFQLCQIIYYRDAEKHNQTPKETDGEQEFSNRNKEIARLKTLAKTMKRKRRKHSEKSNFENSNILLVCKLDWYFNFAQNLWNYTKNLQIRFYITSVDNLQLDFPDFTLHIKFCLVGHLVML